MDLPIGRRLEETMRSGPFGSSCDPSVPTNKGAAPKAPRKFLGLSDRFYRFSIDFQAFGGEISCAEGALAVKRPKPDSEWGRKRGGAQGKVKSTILVIS